MANLREELAAALPGLQKAVFSQPADKLSDQKVTVRPVRMKGKLSYQVERFRDNKAFHQNLDDSALLSLVENELAQRGPLEVFVRVFDPDGNLLSDGKGATFTLGEETLQATASREVDYQGLEVDLGIYVNNIPSFTKGIYTVKAYTNASLLGSAELLLR